MTDDRNTTDNDTDTNTDNNTDNNSDAETTISRTRTRSRRTTRSPRPGTGLQGATSGERTDAPDGEPSDASEEPQRRSSGGRDAGAAEDAATVIRRRRRRRGGRGRGGRAEGGAAAAPDVDGADNDGPDADGPDADGPDGDVPEGEGRPAAEKGTARRPGPARGSRRGRGRDRGRSTGDRERGDEADADEDTTDTAQTDPAPTESGLDDRDGGEEGGEGGDETKSSSMRLQTRGTRRRSAAATARRGRQGRRPLGGVSEETRRAIVEGPPRRMLVTVGETRTQIAVLEERRLMEHYVTRKEDVSYVGNIYLGRVQNVLPGMEAAFIDIGKGRNGVLYAGEVSYDEADIEGDLPRIEDTLKPGQTVLVQVTKDPMGTKGARLTQMLSIAGRYCVLAPADGMLGISRKLADEERDRLRKILKDIKPEKYGLIVRTAAEGATKEQLEADVARLTRIWDQIQRRSEEAKPLEPVYEEPGLVIRVIRDVFGPEYSDLIVDSEELAGQVRTYLGDVSPEMVDKVAVHTGEQKIFDAYEVTTQIRRALEKKVWLRSGGYLIVEKTEAMWVIDVNTGKFVGKDNLEATVLKNNLEAGEEIAHQLRLRDMGGIIVIDFVDMLVPANRDEVLKRFKRELARDKTKSRVMDISKLGLVQMTRKNVSHGLTETFTTRCETCEGRGATILEPFN